MAVLFGGRGLVSAFPCAGLGFRVDPLPSIVNPPYLKTRTLTPPGKGITTGVKVASHQTLIHDMTYSYSHLASAPHLTHQRGAEGGLTLELMNPD